MMETHRMQFVAADLIPKGEGELATIIANLRRTNGVLWTQQGEGESAVITFYWRSEEEGD